MIKELVNSSLGIKEKLKKSFMYANIKRGVYKSWGKRFKNIEPTYLSPVNKNNELLHTKKWKNFHGKVNLNTYRLCTNLSGVLSVNYVPEEIFSIDIEKSLNPDLKVDYLSNKSFYNNWFDKGLFPKDIFHKIDGAYYNQNLDPISIDMVEKLKIDFPVVLKPNKDTFGGEDINFVKDKINLLELISSRNNFVVQEKLDQHSFFAKYNNKGINTIRVCTYRSVVDNTTKILNASLRFGVRGSLDNETAGGVVCNITDEGNLCGSAKDKYAFNFTEHPDSKIAFEGKIPHFEDMLEIAKKVSEKIFYARLISLDMCLDSDENWRVIEINLTGQTIRFAQYAGLPFFGKYTDEVIKYCANNHWLLRK